MEYAKTDVRSPTLLLFAVPLLGVQLLGHSPFTLRLFPLLCAETILKVLLGLKIYVYLFGHAFVFYGHLRVRSHSRDHVVPMNEYKHVYSRCSNGSMFHFG